MSFGVSHIKAVGAAIIPVIPLAIGSLAVGLAATKEEVSAAAPFSSPSSGATVSSF